MKLFTKFWFALLCVFMVGVTNVYADDEVALTKDMFFTWDGDGANASSIAAAEVDFNIGNDVELGGGDMVCGTGGVLYLTYADLTGSTKLIITGTAGLPLRVLMNRQESNSGPLVEKKPTIGDDGTVEVDLTDLTFVHLNAIKVNWGQTKGKITSIVMVKPSDPLASYKENLKKALAKGKLINELAYTDESFGALGLVIASGEEELAAAAATAESLTGAATNINNAIAALVLKKGFTSLKDVPFGAWNGWGADAELTQAGNPAWVLFEATGQSYGDPSVNSYADVSAYDKLYIVTASGTPRILLNRTADGGQWSENEDESNLIDNTKGGWSAKYFSTDDKVYIVDLAQLVADKGFAHLTAIKSYDNNVVTGLYLYTATPDYYVVGSMNEWTASDSYKMTLNEAAEGVVEYMFTFDAEANTEIKVKDNKGTWYPSDGGNYKINDAGEYTIYFRPNADGGEGWHYGVIYAAKKEEPAPALNTYTATFTTNQNWEKVYAYAWSGDGEGAVKFLGDWPGTELAATEGVYTVTIQAEAAPEKIIFNSGAGAKTANLAFEDGKAYAYNVEDSELMASAKALAAADPNAVAVGKLNAAITAALSTGDDSNLQAAIDQFKADNAPLETDMTAQFNSLATTQWTGSSGQVGWAAPKVTTNSGLNVAAWERYNGSCDWTGDIMSSSVTGLTPGTYKIELYGAAAFTFGRGFGSTDFTGDFSKETSDTYQENDAITENTGVTLFAETSEGTVSEEIPIWYATNFNTSGIATATLENVIVGAAGTIKIGLSKTSTSTNWHVVQLKGVTAQVLAKDLYATYQAELTDLIAKAKALTGSTDKTALEAAIATAEEATTTKANWYNTDEIKDIINELKNAAQAYEIANRFTYNGVAYIIDAESGKFMAAGNDYGTRGIVNNIGLDLTFSANADNTVDIETGVKNSDTNHFLGSNLYMDSQSYGWILREQEFGFYIQNIEGQYISIDSNDNLVMSEEPHLWIIVTDQGVQAQRLEDLQEATAENPVDATFLIKGANFNRNDQRNNAWTVSEDCTNKNLSGGNQVNNCAESFHSTFTIMQTISGAPAGKYTLTAQGFYRQDEYEGDAPAAPQFFANEVNGDVPVKTGEEDGMSAASVSFANGLYTIDPIEFEVKEDGMIYLGITASTNTQWVIWDNFQLTYYGPVPATTYTVSVAEAVNGQVEVDKTVAAEGENVTVTVTPAEGYMVDEAYWTYGEGENVTKTNIEEPAEGNAAQFTMPAANVTVTVTFKAISGPAETKLYIIGDGTANAWNGTTEMTYKEETQTFECIVESESAIYIAIGDAAFTDWDDFNANHRWAIGTGDQDATVGVATQLQKANGTLKLAAGAYIVSVTKDMQCTITKTVPTGINAIAADRLNGVLYNLNGQKVLKAQKGLYIINGKKVVKK